jgi:hypothetical protein
MTEEPVAGMLSNIVEVDETYVGGKARIKGEPKRGTGTEKQPVMALVERNNDEVHCKPVECVDGKTLRGEMAAMVATGAVLTASGCTAYNEVGEMRTGAHRPINHKTGEYARMMEPGPSVNPDTAEPIFALLKRGHWRDPPPFAYTPSWLMQRVQFPMASSQSHGRCT